jgi:hypothetical protein
MMRKANLVRLVGVFFGVLACCGPALASDANLIAHWSFDEGAGTIAYDSAGNNDGTIYGATWTTGQIGGALDFDGSNDLVEVPDSLSMRNIDGSAAEYSICLWVNTTQTGAAIWDQTAIFDRRATLTLSGKREWVAHIFLNEDNAIAFLIHIGDGTPFILNDDMAINDGAWHHVVATRKNTEYVKIYVDGNERQSGAPSISTSTTEITTIGMRRSNNNYYKGYLDGAIDDVCIYNRALSAEEVEELYLMEAPAHERAIMKIEDAVNEKEKMLQGIDDALGDEQDASEYLEELLEARDYGDLKKGDVIKAQQRIHSAMQHQEQSADALDKSIEGLYDALDCLGWEPEPEPNVPEPNVPVPEPNFPVPAVGRGRSAAGK